MSKELISLVVVFPILITLWGSWLCTNQINFKSCPVQCGSSVLRSTNGQYGGDMPESSGNTTRDYRENQGIWYGAYTFDVIYSFIEPSSWRRRTRRLIWSWQSDPAVLLTSLTLDPKLAVFTVVGMQEPRLVKLSPPDCPAIARPLRCDGKDSWRHDAHTGAATARCLFRNFEDFCTEKELNKT